jgi:hypothetical protein
MLDMKRRAFISLLGGAAAWPLAARAQQSGKIPRVGYIRPGTQDNDAYREEIVRAMRDLGYVEGRNIAYEFRYYGDDVEAISSHVSDLLRVKVDGSLGDLRLLSQRRSTSYRGRTEHVARGSLWKRFGLTAQRASQIGGLFLEQHRGRYGHWRHGGGILLG